MSPRTFIGVDLGGGKGKRTALAVLERCKVGVTVTGLHPRAGDAPLYDQALLQAIRSRAERAVLCIDAPLTLPPCIRCQVPLCPGQAACVDGEVVAMRRLSATGVQSGRDHRRGKPDVTPYTQRATEVYLHRRRELRPRETLGQGMGPLTARAAHLVRALADLFTLNDNLVEVYPRATLEALGFRATYKKRIDQRIEILARLGDLSFAPGIWREECRQSDHAFDAVICAYTGYLRSRDAWVLEPDLAGPDGRTGWIWVPPEIAVARTRAAPE